MMFFILSKIAWFLIEPTNLLIFTLVAATGMLWRGHTRAATYTLTATSTALLLVIVLPVGDALLVPLEQRFKVPELPARLDGIILLGGAQQPLLTKAYHQPEMNGAAETMTTFLALARAHPEATLVFSGGSGDIRHQGLSEADTMKLFLRQQGFDAGRVIYERRSRNTYENAIFAKRLVNPAPGQRWVLVASAYGMPRAVGVFRAAGWPVIPYPCNYHVGHRLHLLPSLHFSGSLDSLSMALHEWVGLAAYYVAGKTAALFPG